MNTKSNEPDYDTWKLDNGEKSKLSPCDDCSKPAYPLLEVMGTRKEVCEDCAEHYQCCPSCNQPGIDTAFDFGHDEMCNDCVEKSVDSYGDYD